MLKFKNTKAKGGLIQLRGGSEQPLQWASGPTSSTGTADDGEAFLKVEEKTLNLQFYIQPNCHPAVRA